MVDFSNVADFNLTEMPYATGGKPGQITVDIHETKMPYGKHLFSHTDKANQSVSPDFEPEEDESNRHTLLVAMPYTTNYGNGAGGYSKARLRALATVNFGKPRLRLGGQFQRLPVDEREDDNLVLHGT